jgi:uncharacterized membrane protein YdjX (TVP38/TMEM64 family)
MSGITQHLLDRLDLWHDTLLQLGWLGVFGFAAGLIVLQMVFIPLSVFAVAGGAIFGFWKTFIAVTIGTNAGAAVNFFLARYVARGAVNRYLAHHEKFRLIDAAVGREGGKIVALLRLCPLPFGLCNYAYGLTSIPFWKYFLATFLAIIPANCFFVWVGATAHDGLKMATDKSHQNHTAQYVMYGVGFVAFYCALSYITKLAKAAIARSQPENTDTTGQDVNKAQATLGEAGKKPQDGKTEPASDQAPV